MKRPMLETGADQMDNPDISIIRLGRETRPADRFLISQVQSPRIGTKQWQLAIVVEINSAWHPARELGATITQSFIRFFTQSSNQSTLTKFEDALKQLNATLDIQVEKLGVVPNCVLLVTAGDEVYFSTLGDGKVMLLRHGRLSTIAGDDRDRKQRQNAFATVTSGELAEDDWLFGANKDFADVINQLDLEQVAAATPEELERLLTEQAELSDARATIVGVAARLTPGQGRLLAVRLDELESRTPLRLPRVSMPKLKRPDLSGLLGLAGSLLKRFHRPTLSVRQWLLVGCGTIITIALMIGAYRIIRHPDGPVTAAPTLTSELSAATPEDQRRLLSEKLTPETYHALSASDQTLMANLLNANGISLLPLPAESNALGEKIIAIDSLDSNSDELYAIDQTGQIWHRQAATMAKLNQKQLISQPVGLVAFSANKLVVTDEVGNVWLYDGSAETPTSLNLPAPLASGKKLAQKYRQNLYLFNSTDGQIFRVGNFGTDLTGATLYTKTGVVTNQPISDWAINGSVLLLGENGRVISLQRNTLDSLAIDLPVNGHGRLRADSNRIVAASGKFIYVYGANGSKTKEQFLLSLDEPTGVALGANQQTWLAIGTKIYLLPAS